MRDCDRCGKKIIYGALCERCNGYLDGLRENRKREADILHEFEEWLKNQIAGIDNNGTSSKNQILVVRQDRWSDAVEVYLEEMEQREEYVKERELQT